MVLTYRAALENDLVLDLHKRSSIEGFRAALPSLKSSIKKAHFISFCNEVFEAIKRQFRPDSLQLEGCLPEKNRKNEITRLLFLYKGTSKL